MLRNGWPSSFKYADGLRLKWYAKNQSLVVHTLPTRGQSLLKSLLTYLDQSYTIRDAKLLSVR